MNIPTQTNDAESGISPHSDDGSRRVSRRNLIFGGAAAVAAISLPKDSLASTPLSRAEQSSKNNNGKDDNVNSTADVAETAQTFDADNFTVVPARTFDDLRVGEIPSRQRRSGEIEPAKGKTSTSFFARHSAASAVSTIGFGKR
jgi:hypothetical protein